MCVCMICMYLYMCVCVCVLQVPRRSEHKCHVVSSLLSRTRHWIQRLTRITSPPEGGHLLWKSERSLSSQKPGHSIFCPYGEGRMLHQITSQYVTDPHQWGEQHETAREHFDIAAPQYSTFQNTMLNMISVCDSYLSVRAESGKVNAGIRREGGKGGKGGNGVF